MVALLVIPDPGPPTAAYLVLVALATVSALVPVRWLHAEGVQGFTLEAGVFVALLLTGPTALAPVVLLAASFAAHALRSREPLKWVFNAGRTGLEAAAGAAVFHGLAPVSPSPGDLPSLLAVLAALATSELVSIVTMTELFHRMSAVSRRRAARDVTTLSGVTVVINLAYGLVLAAVAQVSPWITGLAGLLMVGVYVGFRGYAAAVLEGKHAESLNEITRLLLDLPAEQEPVGDLVRKLVADFGAARAEVVVDVAGEWRRWTVGDDGAVTSIVDGLPRTGPVGAAAARDDGLYEPTRTEDGLAGRLSAPVRRGGEPVGAIVLWGRRGMEPWGDGDAALLSAVANELAVALDNMRLFGELEEERARLESESTKLNDILTGASDGILAIDRDGRVEAWNPGMVRITGVDHDVAMGQAWHSVLRLRDAEGSELPPTGDRAATLVTAASEDGEAFAMQVLRADGQWRWLQCTSSLVRGPDGTAAGVVVVARDVTAERELEALKADFIATVSHELRTPLTPLKGFLSTLRNPRARLAPEHLDTIHGSMASQLTRLETLIADLLAVAELEHGSFDLRPERVDLAEVVPDAVTVEAGDQRARCRIEVPAETIVMADPVALVRVVRSLVSNGLKHTSGRVVVTAETADDHVDVLVVDEGPGIAPWDQQRVFNRFERLGDHLTRTQGPGLGLTIARTLARRMRGDVLLTSRTGTGATFRVRLPRPRPHAVPLQVVQDG